MTQEVSTHSRAEAAAFCPRVSAGAKLFQHTAARRRLRGVIFEIQPTVKGFNTQPRGGGCNTPSTIAASSLRFNTQPRGGGCRINPVLLFRFAFQHTAARRRLREPKRSVKRVSCFNTQPRGGGCRHNLH